MSKIESLNVDGLSPKVVINNVLDNVENYDQIYIVCKTKDGFFESWCSNDLTQLPAVALVLQGLAADLIRQKLT